MNIRDFDNPNGDKHDKYDDHGYVIKTAHNKKVSQFKITNLHSTRDEYEYKNTIKNTIMYDSNSLIKFKELFEEFIKTATKHNNKNKIISILTNNSALCLNYEHLLKLKKLDNIYDIIEFKNNCILLAINVILYKYKDKLHNININLDIIITNIANKAIYVSFSYKNKNDNHEPIKLDIEHFRKLCNLDYIVNLCENNDIFDETSYKLKYNNLYDNDNLWDIYVKNGIINVINDISIYNDTKYIKIINPASKYSYDNYVNMIFVTDNFNDGHFNKLDYDVNYNNKNGFYLYDHVFKFKKEQQNTFKLNIKLSMESDMAYNNYKSNNYVKLIISNNLIKNTQLKNIDISQLSTGNIIVFMNKYLRKLTSTYSKKRQYCSDNNRDIVMCSEGVPIKFIKFDIFKYIYQYNIVLINVLRLGGRINTNLCGKNTYLTGITKLIHYMFINNIPIELVYIILNHMFTNFI